MFTWPATNTPVDPLCLQLPESRTTKSTGVATLAHRTLEVEEGQHTWWKFLLWHTVDAQGTPLDLCHFGAVLIHWTIPPSGRDPTETPADTAMRMIVAIIQPTKLNAVQAALTSIGVERMTVCDAQGYAQQRGQRSFYRGTESKTRLLRKITLEIAVNDDFVERTIESIVTAARTGAQGSIGDGKIFVLPMGEAYQVDRDVVGPEAI